MEYYSIKNNIGCPICERTPDRIEENALFCYYCELHIQLVWEWSLASGLELLIVLSPDKEIAADVPNIPPNREILVENPDTHIDDADEGQIPMEKPEIPEIPMGDPMGEIPMGETNIGDDLINYEYETSEKTISEHIVEIMQELPDNICRYGTLRERIIARRGGCSKDGLDNALAKLQTTQRIRKVRHGFYKLT